MTTNAEYLAQIETAILAAIAANPTATSYTIEGQSVSKGELWARLEAIQRMRAGIDGPFEIESRGIT